MKSPNVMCTCESISPGRRAVGIDHDVAGFDYARRRGADRDDAVAVGDDGVPLGERLIEIAGDDRADIDDGDTHGFSTGRARHRAAVIASCC
ncbi:MAG TPA: hypothetical protein VIH62_13210 [Xanthobacteraceae bacterium]